MDSLRIQHSIVPRFNIGSKYDVTRLVTTERVGDKYSILDPSIYIRVTLLFNSVD